MKKIIVMVILSIFIVVNIAAQQLTNGVSMQVQPNGYVIDFNLSDYQIDTVQTDNNGNFLQVVIPNDDYDDLVTDIGLPALPQFNISFHLPENSGKFVVQLKNSVYEQVPLSYPILPHQDYLQTDINPQFVVNSAFYNSTGNLLNYNYRLSDTYYYMGEKGVDVSINPFVYNPVANSLSVLTHCEIVFSYTGDDMPKFIENNLNINNPNIHEYLWAFKNYIDKWHDPYYIEHEIYPTKKSKYLIIAAQRFENNAALQKFIDFREEGYDVTTIYVPAGVANSTIKSLIQSRYNRL
jgi:hypothetical protein